MTCLRQLCVCGMHGASPVQAEGTVMKPAELHITARQAADFALARGGISQPFDEPLAAVRAMVAVQAQYAASIPFAVHARCPSRQTRMDRPCACT